MSWKALGVLQDEIHMRLSLKLPFSVITSNSFLSYFICFKGTGRTLKAVP